MSTPSPTDPRVDQPAISDENLLAQHEKLLGKQPDDRGHYRLMPLVMLFVFAGFIFFGATYLGRFSGHFDPRVYNENMREFSTANAAPVVVDPVVLGEKLFNNAACNTCHQPTGLGIPGAIPPLAGSEWAQGPEDRVIRIVLYGLAGPITVKGNQFNSAMPAFGQVAGGGFNWSDDKIAAVLTYVRQAWGNKAPPITAAKVTEIHNQLGDHKPWLPADLEKIK
ncbi:MAG TPA: cytochrome c [Opitutaceae bacterium]|nr:cytochrome c [Opitutaceae bacterium]